MWKCALAIVAALWLPDAGTHPWVYEVEPNDVQPVQLLPFAHTRMQGGLSDAQDVDRYYMWLGWNFPHLTHWGGHLYFRCPPDQKIIVELWQKFPDGKRQLWGYGESVLGYLRMYVEFVHVPTGPGWPVVGRAQELVVTGDARWYTIWGPPYQYGPPDR